VRPHGALALARHAPRSGARVLDVGCARGETTLDLARLVGAKGSVVGIDACESRLAIARREARTVDARNVSFIRGDAIALQLGVGPAAELLQGAGPAATAARGAIVADLRAALEPFVTARGVVMGSSAWCITAANPS
jgi:tRNA A58 N-methylase Trm61